ncbi:hypothetical protein I4U23_020206 [Adineta vaga]|nr:hypothetical protein I4U23_020206 [Adineta vaga]
MGGNLFINSLVYGWGDYSDYFLAGKRQKDDSDVFFTHTHEKDIIEFIIDCSTQKICYKNLRHQRRQVLSIDMDKCPFPWQLYISLGGRADQISLIDSSSTTTA